MTLSLPQLQSALGVLAYRPDWDLSVYETRAQGVFFAVVAELENSYEPGTQTVVRIKSPVPPMASVEAFYEWLRFRLEVIERHECHEWLRFRHTGKPLFDPHAEGSDEPSE